MKAQAAANVDDYLSALPEDVQRLMQKIREAIIISAPKAEEVISYQMPAYKCNGMLVYFAAFKDHCSLFPASKSVLKIFEAELKPFKTFGGTIQFTLQKPISIKLVKAIVKHRLKENEERQQLKKSASKKIN